MTFFEAMRELEEGKKVRNVNWIDGLHLFKEENKICFSETTKVKCLNDVDLNFGPWEIYKEPILTDEEKEYLNNVIKPFKNKVCHIVKNTISFYDGDFIQICVKSNRKNVYQYINLPAFTRDSIYKNMKVDYKYTVEDLDL